jgi:tetratricopeptide (TPR) repeat protein
MLSRISLAAGIALYLSANFLLVPSAWADDAASSAPPVATAQPWQKDQALETAAWADIQSGGILAIAPHVSDLEQALTNANQTMASAMSSNGAQVVFTDGAAEAMIALVAASSGKSGSSARVEAQDNPYPGIGLCLGSYYNEIGKSDDALRVLNEALALDAVQSGGLGLGEHVPLLISEKGAALNALKRWPNAIAAYDAGLAINGLEAPARALLYRGRGFALTESGRLDDAEASYRESLKLEPGNSRAESELEYIARVRAGQPPTQGGLIPIQPQSVPPATPPTTATTPAPSPVSTPTPN